MKFYKTIFFVLISFILIGCQSKSNEDLVNRTIIEPETKQEKKSETKEVKIKDYPRDTTPGEVITITMAQLEEKISASAENPAFEKSSRKYRRLQRKPGADTHAF